MFVNFIVWEVDSYTIDVFWIRIEKVNFFSSVLGAESSSYKIAHIKVKNLFSSIRIDISCNS